MAIEDTIQEMQNRIKAVSAGAEVKVVKISEEEARLSVYARADDIQKIKDATFQRVIDFLNKDGLDIQVFVYDKDAPPLKGE